ncbi:sigma-70 family RNA polymerase sigma factor [Aeromicrobium sp. Leaf350]|uniref:sigma-70 family RNA polymerase sigma factor n=1 Tax=Aeromicrobium sp. Leaf350 TaxID=2876565 RepID=UPI001E53CDC1|nr:sigma-70 family RNA polymerase sigma factor [Aeromicrobium sp. Leaf350]
MSVSVDLEEQSHRLLTEAHSHGSLQRERLQNQVIEDNLPLARRLSRRYCGRGVAADDLEQVARLGLLQAVRRFDVEQRSFLAFAIPTILGELRRHFRDQAWVVRPGRRIQEVQAAATAARDDLRAELSREPTSHEVADRIDQPVAALTEADAVAGAFSPRSLDAPTPGTDVALAQTLGAEDPNLALAEGLVAVAPAIRALDERDRRLLQLRFAEDRKQKDIGRELGISQMQVSRRLTTVLARLRDAVDDTPLAS